MLVGQLLSHKWLSVFPHVEVGKAAHVVTHCRFCCASPNVFVGQMASQVRVSVFPHAKVGQVVTQVEADRNVPAAHDRHWLTFDAAHVAQLLEQATVNA